MTVDEPRSNFLSFADPLSEPDAKLSHLPTKEAPHAVPIIIDAGSYRFRAGYANESKPSCTISIGPFDSLIPCLVMFEPVVHRYQVKAGEPARFAIGTSAPSGVTKTSSRTPFESPTSPIIVHPSSTEHILDHIFAKLHVKGERVDHPVVMTEPLGNPGYCRKEMSEMLFEGYGVPKVSYGIDSLFALSSQGITPGSTLVISLGNCATHVIPVVNGKMVASGVKRVNWGGAVASDHLLRLLQTKYPGFPSRMTLGQAQDAFHKACILSDSYSDKLREIPTALEKEDFVLQFPFVPTDLEREAALAQAREALALKRKEQADKLREKARLKKEAKLDAKKQHLQALLHIKADVSPRTDASVKKRRGTQEEEEEGEDIDEMIEEDEDDLSERLAQHGYFSLGELEEAIEGAQRDLRLFENKIAGIEEPKEEPDYSLLEIPDEELDAAQIQEKRRQRLMKSGADARERLKAEKEIALKNEAEIKAKNDKKRQEDFSAWRSEMYQKRTRLVNLMKSRQQKKDALSNRKSNASSARLRAVMSLGTDKEAIDPKAEDDDGFGEDDEDWQVYRDIRSGPADPLLGEEDDEEEALQAVLINVEEELEKYDDSFYKVLAEEFAQSRTIIDRLARPVVADDEAARHQLHLNVERYRVPEALFQPQAILGHDTAGLDETIQFVLSGFDSKVQQELTSNIFLTGGTAALPNLIPRLTSELTALRPSGEPINITMSTDLQTDSWMGAAKLALSGDIPWITKEWYEEHGGELLQSTWFTNPY